MHAAARFVQAQEILAFTGPSVTGFEGARFERTEGEREVSLYFSTRLHAARCVFDSTVNFDTAS